jgi:hypothetical protein
MKEGFGMKLWTSCVSVLLLMAATAYGQIVIEGADGSDGPLNCATLGLTDCATTCTAGSPCEREIDLSLAANGSWQDASPVEGQGIYDAEQWAVIFKYSSVDIPEHVTVKFKNHPSRAPVMWLVSGPVTIAGTINLDGADGHGNNDPPTYAEPGPGGFRGGRGSTENLHQSGGFGPGGAACGTETSQCPGAGGGYGSAGVTTWCSVAGGTYGNPGVFPLIGGSGGSGLGYGSEGAGGGAGGGAILIACPSTITLPGMITARGGNGGPFSGGYEGGGGSGGGIRLIAHSISCGAAQCGGQEGLLRATGGTTGAGNGGDGRIRIEANDNGLLDLGEPAYTEGLPGTNPTIFKKSATATPTIAAVTLGGALVPDDPRAGLTVGEQDVFLTTPGATQLEIRVKNVPINTPVDAQVKVRVVSAIGTVREADATYDSGDFATSTWFANVDLPDRFSAINVRVILPPSP